MYRDSLDLKIREDRCISCGTCVRECVNCVLEMDAKSGRPRVVSGGEARCIHCAHCLMACPTAAFSLDGINPDQCGKPEPGADFSSVLNLVKKRRSIRHWKDQNVAPEALEKLLTSLRYTPTGVNFGHLRFTVIRDKEKMNQFRDQFYEEFFTRFGNSDEAKAWKAAREQGKDVVFRSAPHMIVASCDEHSFCGHDDCVIALSCFEIMANAMGIGTVWFGRLMSIYHNFMPELVKRLGIPAGYKPGYAMLFGYSDAKFYRTIDRECPVIDVWK